MVIGRYLVEKKEEIRNLKVEDRLIDFPIINFGVAVIGPRRAGESFSLFNLIKTKGLKDEDYIFVNFEDEEIISLPRKEKVKIIDAHIELYKKHPKYIFLDEIISLERWKNFVYSLIEKRGIIYSLPGQIQNF